MIDNQHNPNLNDKLIYFDNDNDCNLDDLLKPINESFQNENLDTSQ